MVRYQLNIRYFTAKKWLEPVYAKHKPITVGSKQKLNPIIFKTHAKSYHYTYQEKHHHFPYIGPLCFHRQLQSQEVVTIAAIIKLP